MPEPASAFVDRAKARSKRSRASAVALAMALAAVATAASGALYKWTDANGRVVYSDQPPPAGTNATPEVLRGPSAPANPNALKELAAKDAELKKRQLERADDAKKAEKTKVDAERRTDSCSQLRGQIKLLSGDDVVYRANEKGERVYMDDEMKRKERERIETMVREYNCPPA